MRFLAAIIYSLSRPLTISLTLVLTFTACPYTQNQNSDDFLPDSNTSTTISDTNQPRRNVGRRNDFSYSKIDSLRIFPDEMVLAINETQSLKLEATYSDSSVKDMSFEAEWIITYPGIGEVRRDNGLYLKALNSGEATLLANLEGRTAEIPIKVFSQDIDNIKVKVPGLQLGITQPMEATAYYQDGRFVDVTDLVNWEIADPSVFKMQENPPRIKPLLVGSSLITAHYKSIKASYLFRVYPPKDIKSIKIQLPEDGFITLGAEEQLKLIAELESGESKDVTAYARWISGDKNGLFIAMEENTRGIGRGLKIGDFNITAQLGQLSASAKVPVRPGCLDLEILPSESIISYLSVETTIKVLCVAANGEKSDKTAEVTFDFVADEATIIASGEKKGTLIPRKVTESSLNGTVSLENLEKSFSVDVYEKPLRDITIQGVPNLPSCNNQAPFQLTAIGIFGEGKEQDMKDITNLVEWTSATPATLSVENEVGKKGVITTISKGYAKLLASATAIDGKIVTTQADLTITDPTPTGVEINPYQFDPGLFKARGPLIEPPYTLPKGAKISLALSLQMSCGENLDYSSSSDMTLTASDNLEASFEFGSWTVKALERSESGQISASYKEADNMQDTISIQLTPHEVERLVVRYAGNNSTDQIPGTSNPYWVERGDVTELKAFAIYTDGYEQDVTSAVNSMDDDPNSVSVHDLTITWQSLDPSLAAVDSVGSVTGISEGEAEISASLTIDYNDIDREDPSPITSKLSDSGNSSIFLPLEVRSPCSVGGERYSYYCFKLGAAGESCEQTCAAEGGVQIDGMNLISDSSEACQAVANSLLSSPVVIDPFQPDRALGCALDGILIRDSSQSASALYKDVQRICACK